MKPKYTKEDLFHSLPDFISKTIEDKELIKEIEMEIQSNHEFKTEFNEISNTLNFLNSTELESPDQNYFNNLSVKINERISREKTPDGIWEKLGLIWKILIPAVPIIIIAILLFNSLKKEQQENKITENSINTVKPIEKNSDNKNAEGLPLQKEESLESNSKKLSTKSSKQKTLQKTSQETSQKTSIDKKLNVIEADITGKSTDNNNLSNEKSETIPEEDESLIDLMADNVDNPEYANPESEEDILFLRDDEDNFEEELMEFTPEEQKEILKNLNKPQI